MTDYVRALIARIRALLGNRRADREFDDEIQAHLELLTDRYIRRGMTPLAIASAIIRRCNVSATIVVVMYAPTSRRATRLKNFLHSTDTQPK
ncbi:MAG: hypothetical protein J2P41_18030 [Blastocatellia bacterium]|nr:hypothetical protein [Blastocatellia bacterium]